MYIGVYVSFIYLVFNNFVLFYVQRPPNVRVNHARMEQHALIYPQMEYSVIAQNLSLVLCVTSKSYVSN